MTFLCLCFAWLGSSTLGRECPVMAELLLRIPRMPVAECNPMALIFIYYSLVTELQRFRDLGPFAASLQLVLVQALKIHAAGC